MYEIIHKQGCSVFNQQNQLYEVDHIQIYGAILYMSKLINTDKESSIFLGS